MKKTNLDMLQKNVQEYKDGLKKLEEEKNKLALEKMQVKLEAIEDEIIKASKEGKTSYVFTLMESYTKPIYIEEVFRYFEARGLTVTVKIFPMLSEVLFNFSIRSKAVYQVTVSWK